MDGESAGIRLTNDATLESEASSIQGYRRRRRCRMQRRDHEASEGTVKRQRGNQGCISREKIPHARPELPRSRSGEKRVKFRPCQSEARYTQVVVEYVGLCCCPSYKCRFYCHATIKFRHAIIKILRTYKHLGFG